MKHVVIGLVFLACDGKRGSTVLDPTQVEFNGHEYTVRRWEERFESGFYLTTEGDSRKLVGARSDRRQLSPCPKPHVIALDANGDGKRDIVFYTCGYVEIYADHAHTLNHADPVVGERKEKHWVHLDPATYPGLAELEPLIHQMDPDIE